MDWFELLFRFKETPQNIKNNVLIDGDELITSTPGTNEKLVFKYGKLETPTVKELRERIKNKHRGLIRVSEIFGNAGEIHKRPENENALFQVASQFNLLEMMSPENTPEQGITNYQYDRTQGPSCAMACPAGTLYRNYFTKVNTLSKIEEMFDEKYWEMKNGYALFQTQGVYKLNDQILDNRKEMIENLQVGIQWNTEVGRTNRLVSQIYCSAVPVSYNYKIPKGSLKEFASLILEGTYEATFLAGILNPKSNKVFLTLVGAGAFGNDKEWVIKAIKKNIEKYKNYDLDIVFITYAGYGDKDVKKIMDDYNEE